ncbi:MAG: biotin--[acetyl-CoA-carboxylase] ligase [Planctomycetes bacterium]|nr:biotin--[acetyl-CoA-carboxylase] ligase [Planctomycetota bacterium]
MASHPYQTCGDEFSRSDLDRIVAETFVHHTDYHPKLESTNDRALEIAREGADFHAATLVLADRQTAGRGRGENRWWSDAGALTFSLLLPNESLSLPPADKPKTSLVAGLAVGDAIEQLVRGEKAQLKWPNDVYLRGRKVCGILVETIDGSGSVLVIGIGVNVNNSLSNAPDDLRSTATALCDVTGRAVARTDLLVVILQHLELQLRKLRSGNSQLQRRWQERCLLTGQTIHVDTPSRQLVGVCRGIDDHGALLLEIGTSVERCLAGVVTLQPSSLDS